MKNDDWLKLEVEQVFETLRSFLTLQVQVLSILLVVNVTVIGFGVSNQSTGPLLLGAMVSGATLGILLSFDSKILSPLYYRAIILKAKLGNDNLDFFPVFFSTFYYPDLPGKLEAISNVEDVRQRTKLLRNVFLRWGGKRYLFVASAAIFQLALVPILSFYFGWSFP